MLREGEAALVGDNDVIQHPDVHQGQCLAQAPGNQLIRLARLADAGRMGMRQNERHRIVSERLTHYFSRMHVSAVGSTAKQLLKGDQSMVVVQEETAEDL